MAFELASPVVKVTVDTTEVSRSLNAVRGNFKNSFATMTKNITGFTRAFKKVAAPILEVSKWYMAAVTGLAAKALHALYGDNTSAGKAWKKTFDVFKIRLNTEMSRIGALLLKSPIFGSTIPQWMDKLIDVLKRIDLAKVKEMVSLFEKAAIAVLTIKTISTVGSVLSGITKLSALSVIGSAGGVGVKMGAGFGIGATIFAFIKGIFGFLTGSTKNYISMLWKSGDKTHTVTMFANKAGYFQDMISNFFRTIFSWKGLRTIMGKGIKIGSDFMIKHFAKLGLAAVLLSTLFYGFAQAWEGIKIVFKALWNILGGLVSKIREVISGIATPAAKLFGINNSGSKKDERVGGSIGTNEERPSLWYITKHIGAFMSAAASGIGGFLGNTSELWGKSLDDKDKNLKGWTDYFVNKNAEAGTSAMENYWSKSFFKDMNTEWKKPTVIKEAMASVNKEDFTGRYVALTEGNKFAQDIAHKDNEYLKQIASSVKSLNDLAQGK